MTDKGVSWIVTSREDGQNVGDWHWVEKETLGWLKKQFREVAAARGKPLCPATSTHGAINLDPASSDSALDASGEATANNRRGKTIFLYELEITARWTLEGDPSVSGTVLFPYVGDDNEGEKWDVKVTCSSSSSVTKKRQEEVTTIVRAEAVPALVSMISESIAAMKQHFGTKRHAESAAPSPGPRTPPPAVPIQQQKQQPPPPKVSSGVQVEMEEMFSSASPKVIYDLLLDPQRMSMVTGGATIDRNIGGSFSLFNGSVSGSIVELVAESRIVERWRFSSWPEGHFSLVTIELSTKAGDTVVRLKQVGIPREDVERTEQGWRDNIWNRIRMLFGFGGPSSPM